MPVPSHNNNNNNFKRISEIEKKREPINYCHLNSGEKIVNKSDNSDENIYMKDIETTVKEIRNITCAIRRTSIVMPELLRIFHQHGFHEELLNVIEELTYAIHDTTVAVRAVTRSLDNRQSTEDPTESIERN
jgi:hypothetical protein